MIQTNSGNKISRKSNIYTPSNISIQGNSIIHDNVTIRSDFRTITLGQYSIINKNTTLSPPFKLYKNTFSFYPMKIGNYVDIGLNCVLSSSAIGSWVQIGDNCVIGKFCTIKDCVVIEKDSYLSPNTVCASFGVYGGNPAVLVKELQPCFVQVMEERCRMMYERS